MIAARPEEPKPLDLEALSDRTTELALSAVGTMLAAAAFASLVQMAGLSRRASLVALRWRAPRRRTRPVWIAFTFPTRLPGDDPTMAIEVELIQKAWRRAIVKARQRGWCVMSVRDCVLADGVRRGVARTVARMPAGEQVELRATVSLLDGVRRVSIGAGL